jgi:hypothetical protein
LAELRRLTATDSTVETTPLNGARRPRGRRSGQMNRWSRTFHVYVSMGCMLIVAFFAATGRTLNHPSWSLGSTSTSTHQGTVPAGSISGSTVDFLAISEYVRDTYGVTGQVTDYGTDGDRGHIDYAGPGSSASATFSLTDSTLTTTITQGDLLAVLNDIHKGRNTASSWGWVIDASAILLLFITFTGVGIQVFQRKRRRSALVTAGVLAVGSVVAIWLVAH